MTSRKKIAAISKAAKKYDCAVCLKTGAHPPGMMIAECEEDGMEGLAGWVASVKVRATMIDFYASMRALYKYLWTCERDLTVLDAIISY